MLEADPLDDEALDQEVELDPTSTAFIKELVDRSMIFMQALCNNTLFPYQFEVARRIIESLLIGDGEEITGLQSRQCLDGDTIVLRRDGSACRLRDHEDGWSTGVRPTKRYALRGGWDFIATDNHPIWTDRGWVKAGDLKLGDRVAVLTDEWQRWGVEKPGQPDLARFLGFMVTDGYGWATKDQSLKFTNTRESYLAEMTELGERLFGVTAKRYVKGNSHDLLYTTKGRENPAMAWMRERDWDDGFPTEVFGWGREAVQAFVNAAWCGDGYVSTKIVRGCPRPEIGLALGNRPVYARYWQSLLQKAGVASVIKTETMAKGTGVFHRLVINMNRRNVERFKAFVGEIPEKPYADWWGACQTAGRGSTLEGRRMRPIEQVGLDGEPLGFTTVQSITDAGEREVFDVCYPDKGWFIANGVKVHNSGKTEAIANAVATAMVLFPKLAKMFPHVESVAKFKNGVMVGTFAPVEQQAETLFSRIVTNLTNDHAIEIMLDPEIDDAPDGKGRIIRLKKSGSFCRMQTANPRAQIESKSYHLIVVDEAQDADDYVVKKSIHPMLAFYNGTIVKIGTPSTTKGDFYRAIQLNKRRQTQGKRKNHFEFDWRHCARYNKNYAKFIAKEKVRLGEDSDEFQLSYALRWLLDRGMFTTESELDQLGDITMQIVPHWFKSPLVVGIDPARKMDSTVVTVMWVDWDRPDEFGFFDCRVLNWLELHGEAWEEQYFRIKEFLSHYSVVMGAVDVQGVGDAVLGRMQVLMPEVEWHEMGSNTGEQSERWKHLMQLMQRRKVGWPAHSKTRRLKVYKRFRQQFEDLEKKYQGKFMLAEAPDEPHAHDDYPDSLALACMLTKDFSLPEIEVSSSPFIERRR